MRDEVKVRPRFSRGQERPGDTPGKYVRPNFARGQSLIRMPGQGHMGEFATGQERAIHHPERHYPGRFSRGQERLES